VAVAAPQDRLQHSPAVQRGAGQQVDDGQDQVHQRLPAHRAHNQPADTGRGQQQAEDPECRTEQQAGERPDPGDQQLQPRGGELLAEAGHPTEQPEGAVLDLDSSGPPGRDGVAELERAQGAEEQPGPGQPGEPEGPQAVAGQPNGRI
jgi:hypothetical protein